MTLSNRNVFFKVGIAFGALAVLFVAAVSFILIPAYSSIETSNIGRGAGVFQAVFGQLLQPNFYAVHALIAALALYAFITLYLIHRFFEKTQSPEILFVAFFVMSLACETARFMLPLYRTGGISSLSVLLIARILLFGRYFGLFSLFAASFYAAGLEAQKQQAFIFIAAITSLIIALGIPVDTFSWTASFNAVYGYASMLRMLNAGILLITVITFLIAAYARGSREYIFIAIGSFLVLAGRSILLNADTWTGLAGILPLALGIWFICNYLHKVYLWL